MTAQIRPNRMEVSDRFPMLGFAVRVDEPNVEAEVVLASEVALFSPQNRARRTAANFYSSREHGTLTVPRGDGVFVVAPEVLARFIGSEKLYFGLATGHAGNGGLSVDALPRDGSPYVSLRGFTGRTLRRSFTSNRGAPPLRLEWTGDTPRPGSETAATARAPAFAGAGAPIGASNGSQATKAPPPPSGGDYDDGFGPMPSIPARESAYRGADTTAPSQARMGLMLSSGTTARDALDWIMHRVEQVVAFAGNDVSPPSLYRLGGGSATFVQAWEAMLGVTGILSGFNAFLAGLPALARSTGITLSIGPALDTPLFGGGVGVVFGPDGQVALFGAGEISADFQGLSEFVSSLKLALQAKMKLGYNHGGIDGFAGLAKVGAVNIGEEIVGGAELWLDGSGRGLGGAVSIGVGMALQLAAQEPQPRTPASGLVFDGEDMERARTVARHHRDLFQWIPPQSIVDQMTARGFGIQRIADAIGDINLDHYQIRIDSFPAGWDGQRLLQHFIRHVNDFVDTGNTSFTPYGPSDVATLASANPLGTVFNLNIVGPDNASVVISAAEPQYYAVTTIRTPDTGDHPVSGHRQFGYFIEDGVTTFYTRGADRSTMPIPGTEWLIWSGAESLWQSFQQKVAAWVRNNGGSATILPPFSQRFNPTAMRLTYGHFDTAQGLSVEEPAAATPTIVRPSMPGDQRERAGRIGGQFAGRLGEALDLGLQPRALDALLDTLDPPAAAQPMSYTKSANRPMASAQSTTRSINWDDVELIPQPTGKTCWAAAGAMVIGWRDQVSLTPETVAGICARSTLQGLNPYERVAFASEIGLETEPPQSYSVDGFYELLTYKGPLWVSKIAGGGGGNGGHAVVVTGMYSDGDQHFVRIADPWDRVVGAPGAPGNYASTHSTGSRYIMRYEDFANEYELRIVGDPPTPQILHSGTTAGRTPNTGTGSAPEGYAMAVAPEGSARRAAARPRAMDAGAIATIAGTAVTLISGNSGDIKWDLARWAGKKHPNDVAPAQQAPWNPAEVVLNQWPKISDSGIDDIYAWFSISWQFDGTSLGNVYLNPWGDGNSRSDAIGWGLSVSTVIEDDARLYPRSADAVVPGAAEVPALHVVVNYSFDHSLIDDRAAQSRITLYGDGTYQITSRWLQPPMFPTTPRNVTRRL